jgi:hypothetical protein
MTDSPNGNQHYNSMNWRIYHKYLDNQSTEIMMIYKQGCLPFHKWKAKAGQFTCDNLPNHATNTALVLEREMGLLSRNFMSPLNHLFYRQRQKYKSLGQVRLTDCCCLPQHLSSNPWFPELEEYNL